MRTAIEETNRRRAKQLAYNQEHGITPRTIVKAVDMQLASIVEADYVTVPADDGLVDEVASEEQLHQLIAQLEQRMRESAKKFEFERAAQLRDRVRSLKQRDLGALFSPSHEAPPGDGGAPAAESASAVPAATTASPETPDPPPRRFRRKK
jgi:hypothetical protein